MTISEFGYIYGLVDPSKDNLIFYIGKSIHPKKRLANHLSKSNLKKSSSCIDYLNNMLENNIRPEIRIICTCRFKNINTMEKRFITIHRKINPNLTNERSGGECWHLSKKRLTEKVRQAAIQMQKSVTIRNCITGDEIVFNSVKDTAAFLNKSNNTISQYLTKTKPGHRKCAGYYIRYSKDSFIEPVRLVDNYNYYRYNKDMELLKIYTTRAEWLEEGLCDSGIYMASSGKRKTAYGCIWRRYEK